VGMGIGIGGEDGCVVTLALQQDWQSRHHAATSAASLGQTQRELINLLVPLTPGWETECTASKTARRWEEGTRGRRIPVEESQNSCWSSVGTDVTLNLLLVIISATEGQDDWAAASSVRLTPAVRGATAANTGVAEVCGGAAGGC